jgi:hypothetical protein
MFEDIILETEQIVLLSSLVEIIRSLPRENRIQFIGYNVLDGTSHITHPHFRNKNIATLPMDIEALDDAGLINVSNRNSTDYRIDVTTKGFQYFEYLQTGGKTIPERIEKRVHNYLNGNRLPQVYPVAFDKWSKAEIKLWSNDTQDELSIIGHLCREAMQEFVTVLVERYKPPGVDVVKSHDVARLKAVIKYCKNKVPSTLLPFLDTLVEHWGALSDLVQRQEHSGQREKELLTWEDARRVVFHTAVVFLEIDKSLSTTA